MTSTTSKRGCKRFLRATHSRWNTVFWVKQPNGSNHTLSRSSTKRGTVVRIAGFTHEITERKQREIELREKNERLERFASIVSHDLRNPLSVADGYLDMEREQSDSENLETVADALNRMHTLIDEMLTLAREGQEVTETKPVLLETVVRSKLEQHRSTKRFTPYRYERPDQSRPDSAGPSV